MAWYDYLNPMTYINGAADVLEGHPGQIKAAYDSAMQSSLANAQQIKNFLMDREQQAQKFYGPIQSMFNSTYGTKGLRPQQQVPTGGMGMLNGMYGGGR